MDKHVNNSNPTNKDTSPDPVEMLYIISPSISLLEFREQVQKLLVEERINEHRIIWDLLPSYDVKVAMAIDEVMRNRLVELQANTQNKEEE